MSGFDANLEKKLQNVLNTQDSIQALSMWVMHHRSQYQRITSLWLKVLKKSKISHRLTLIYLANDVIQNSKRKAQQQAFVDSFREIMKEAALLSRDEKIRSAVERVFNIWEERNIYEADYIAELKDILGSRKGSSRQQKTTLSTPSLSRVKPKVSAEATTSKIVSEFKCSKLTNQISLTQKLNMETTSKETALNNMKQDFSLEQLLKKMKDKSHGHQCTQEMDEAYQMLETVVAALNAEKEARSVLVEHLDQATVYYGTIRRDAKGIVNAYKNFSGRVQGVKTQLDALLKSLSPPPSPPIVDAPSPTNSDDGPLLPHVAEEAPPGGIGQGLPPPPPPPLEEEEEEELEGSAVLLPKVEGVDQPPSPTAVPSPEGSPVGFSPKKTASPIPGVEQVIPGQMTSWMGSFTPHLGTTGSSLDSRLSTMRLAFDSASNSFLETPSPQTNIIPLTASPHPELEIIPALESKIPALVTLTGTDSPLLPLDSPSRSLSPPDPFGLKEWQAVPTLTTVPIDGGATDLFSGKDMDYRNMNGNQNGEQHYAPLTPPIAHPAYCSAPNPWKDVPPPTVPPPAVPPPTWNAPPPAVRDWWPRAMPPRWTPYQRPRPY